MKDEKQFESNLKFDKEMRRIKPETLKWKTQKSGDGIPVRDGVGADDRQSLPGMEKKRQIHSHLRKGEKHNWNFGDDIQCECNKEDFESSSKHFESSSERFESSKAPIWGAQAAILTTNVHSGSLHF